MTLGYICAIGLAVVFMLYLDGSIGVMMLAFLLLMPVISLLMTLIVRRYIGVTLTLPDSSAKQHEVTAVLRVTKHTRLPMPFLRLLITADAHFDPLNPEADPLPDRPQREESGSELRYRRALRYWERLRRRQLAPESLPVCLSMGFAESADYKIRLNPRYCGKGRVTVGAPELSDYLGMFRFRMNREQADIPTAACSMLILPEIPKVKANSELFRSVTNTVQTADEETESTPTFSASAAPGYEHRGYIPGDPLKRINWKLSTKRHQLMVRQDEPIALARLSVVMDFRSDDRSISEKARLMEEEQLIETALGFLMLCAEYGYPCRLSYINEGGTWDDVPIDDGGHLESEALTMLAGGFRDEAELAGVPVLTMQVVQGSGILLLYFTVHPDADTAAELGALSVPAYLIVPLAHAGEAVTPKDGALWLVTPERELVAANEG